MFRRIVFLDSRVPGCGGIEADAGACGALVEVVHRLFVDAGVVLGIFRFCVCRPVQGLFPLSGRYARIQCQQLACVSSRCAGSMAAIVGNCHLLPHLSECKDCHLVAQIVQSQLLEA